MINIFEKFNIHLDLPNDIPKDLCDRIYYYYNKYIFNFSHAPIKGVLGNKKLNADAIKYTLCATMIFDDIDLFNFLLENNYFMKQCSEQLCYFMAFASLSEINIFYFNKLYKYISRDNTRIFDHMDYIKTVINMSCGHNIYLPSSIFKSPKIMENGRFKAVLKNTTTLPIKFVCDIISQMFYNCVPNVKNYITLIKKTPRGSTLKTDCCPFNQELLTFCAKNNITFNDITAVSYHVHELPLPNTKNAIDIYFEINKNHLQNVNTIDNIALWITMCHTKGNAYVLKYIYFKIKKYYDLNTTKIITSTVDKLIPLYYSDIITNDNMCLEIKKKIYDESGTKLHNPYYMALIIDKLHNLNLDKGTTKFYQKILQESKFYIKQYRANINFLILVNYCNISNFAKYYDRLNIKINKYKNDIEYTEFIQNDRNYEAVFDIT